MGDVAYVVELTLQPRRRRPHHAPRTSEYGIDQARPLQTEDTFGKYVRDPHVHICFPQR